MPGHDQRWRGEAKSEADQTLLGVAPPRIDSSVESRPRSPVFVRSGTSVADVEPAPLPRPARPLRASGVALDTPAGTEQNVPAGLRARLEPALRYLRAHPVLGMVLIPALFSLCLIAVTRHAPTHARRVATSDRAAPAEPVIAGSAPTEPLNAAALAELEHRPASSLSSRELLLLAEGHARQKRSAAGALREQLAHDPAVGKDSALQNQLLHLADDTSTALDALSAMALLEPPSGSDLLYEVWTGTSVRSDTTELARALLYSADMRPKASPALAVALDLRVAETCPQYQAILPRALSDGDRRALHLLTKLNARRGCGPKKTEDCFFCLRGNNEQLTATINAVKSRRGPGFASP